MKRTKPSPAQPNQQLIDELNHALNMEEFGCDPDALTLQQAAALYRHLYNVFRRKPK